ncbi:hypothetical protein FB451DRAFT_1114963 [Mycena latifolia]|nr:hypothetical protein FB451DRAFT_1114963 [Mycena latifolia]
MDAQRHRDSNIFSNIDLLLKAKPPDIDTAVYKMKGYVDVPSSIWFRCWESITQSPPNKAQFIQSLLSAHEEQQYQHIIDILSQSIAPLALDRVSGMRALNEMVNRVLTPLQKNMDMIVSGEKGLKIWAPKNKGEYTEFLRQLNIPEDSQMKPDMLLFDLGSLAQHPQVQRRINRIFAGTETHSFLVNTSGSGKTRLVFEGLCQFWGLYFTALRDKSGHGSRDIEMIIGTALRSCPTFTDPLPPRDHPEFSKFLKTNRQIAEVYFCFALLARLRVLHLFVETMSTIVQPEPMDMYRKRWLTLQIKPSLLSDDGADIFQVITAEMIPYLGHVTPFDVQAAIDREIDFIKGKCKSTEQPFYIILDEAQNAAENYFTAFFSETDEGVQRSVLREWLLAWLACYAVLVVTGTGVSGRLIKETMQSAVVKYATYASVSDTGDFSATLDPMIHVFGTTQDVDGNDAEAADQSAYILRFIPPEIHSDERIVRLLRRVTLWLRGRFRFTAGYISELIASEFVTPHDLLNRYIKVITKPPERSRRSIVKTESSSLEGFLPSDSANFVEPHGKFELSARTTFNFDKLLASQHENELATIANITTRFWLRTDLDTPNITPHEADFVEWGFARFFQEPGQENPSSRLDEPIVLLALGQWLNAGFHESIHHRLALKIGENSPVGENTLENYLAFCLTKMLDGNSRLDHIFYFPMNAPAWTSQRAQLVSLYQADSTSDIEESLVTFGSRPSYSIGTHAPDPTSMAEWLKHERDAPICFPPTTMGPDLFFILKLEDNSRIWVALQSKYHGKPLLKAEILKGAVQTVTPSKFFSSLPDDNTIDHLLALPGKRLDAGEYSLLRVVASFPGETRLERGNGTLRNMPFYNDKHPIASLNMSLLAEVTKI